MSPNHIASGTSWSRLLQIICLLLAGWSGEVLAESYAILSLVGDHATVIGQAKQTGSRLEQNPRSVIQLPDSGLDDFAARVAYATIAKVRPNASITAFRAKDPALYAIRDAWLDADVTQVRELLSLVADQLPPSPDGHLLLVTPYRDELRLQTDSDYRGSGKVGGLGFYVDVSTPFHSDAGETATGFLGVFANFQLVLINSQSNAIEAHQRIVVGSTFAAARAKDRTAWNALSPPQKIQALQFLLKREIERALPAMLSSSKP